MTKSIFTMNKQALHFFFMLVTSMVLLACTDDGPTERPVDEVVTTELQSNSELQPDYNGVMPGEPGFQKPEWPREIRQEVYGDPETFSTPRIQFKAKRWEIENNNTLWSMRLDGSDRRRVADKDLLFDGATMIHTPIRSPNNRYIALSMGDKKRGYFRGIIDLKTQTKWEIQTAGGYPHFNWTSDSENVIFYSDGEHYNYHVPSKVLSKRPIIYSRGLFLLPGDQEFLAFKGDGFWIHSFNGEVLRKVKYDIGEQVGSQSPTVSPDGKLLYFSTGAIVHWSDIETGKLLNSVKVKEFIGDTGQVLFSYIPNTLHFPTNSAKLYIINLLTGEKKIIPDEESLIWFMTGIHHSSLINFQNFIKQES
jgi:hypothetical protein